MKVALLYSVLIPFLFSSLAGAQYSSIVGDASGERGSELGAIVDNTYSSECLGFSLPIPPGWSGYTKGAASAKGWVGGMRPLLVMTRIGKQSKMEIVWVSVAPLRDPATTVKDFVTGLGEAQVINAKPQGGELIREPFAVDYSDKRFFRADYKRHPHNGPTAYFGFIYTTFRGYFVGETFMVGSPEELDDAANSLQGISFREDEPNPKCVAGTAGDDLGSTGSFSGIISSTPDTTKANSDLPQRVRVSQGVSTGLLVTKVQPQYPEDARQARIQGSVVLKALIDKNGDVEELTLVSGHPLLAPAAIEAVKQWQYKPYLLNGQAVKVETQIVVNFQLSGH